MAALSQAARAHESKGHAMKQVPRAEIEQLTRGEHGQPHAVLGPHPDGGGVTFRAFKPLARSVTVGDRRRDAGPARARARGCLGRRDGSRDGRRAPSSTTGDVPDYRLEVEYGEGAITVDDPYRFLPTLGEVDLHLVNEGRHELLWTVLGAQVHHYRGRRPAT